MDLWSTERNENRFDCGGFRESEAEGDGCSSLSLCQSSNKIVILSGAPYSLFAFHSAVARSRRTSASLLS